MARPITPHEVRQMDYIATAFDAHKILATGIRDSTRGCRSWEDTEQRCRLFLVCALLTIAHDPTLSMRRMTETLTQGLSNTSQTELGILELVNDTLKLNVSPTAFGWIARRIGQRLNWTPARVPDISLEDRICRKAVLTDVANALVRATIIVDLNEIDLVANDSSAIHSWFKGTRRLYRGKVLPDEAYEGLHPDTAAAIARAQDRPIEDIRRLSGDPNATGEVPTAESLGLPLHHEYPLRELESSILRTTSSADPDAQYSGKTPNRTETATNKDDPDGHTHFYFGKQINSLVIGRNMSPDDAEREARHEHRPFDRTKYRSSSKIRHSNIPNLILAIEVTPAGHAQADPALRNVRRALSYGIDIKLVAVDAEFSSSRAEVWADPIRQHGIKQVLGLRSDQLGFTEYEGALVRGHEVYCPSQDFRSLSQVPRPRPESLKSDVQREDFERRMQEFYDARDRELLYISQIRRNNPDGGVQVSCCARAGEVGCPLVEGSVEAAIEAGKPIINPPAEAEQGKLCKQSTLVIPGEVTGKLAQPLWFGSREWEILNNRRTYVEGGFGSFKNRHNEGVGRGSHEFVGLAWDNLFLGIAASLSNYRLLQNWNEIHQPDIQNILIANDEHEWHGWDLHTKQSALAGAHSASNCRAFSYELITHTCNTVADDQIIRTHDGPGDDPHGYTQAAAATSTEDDECDKPHCRVVHTYGSVVEAVHQLHEREIELAASTIES